MKRKLTEKLIDYKRFAYTLVAVSVFLYLGVVLPTAGKTPFKEHTLMVFTALFLVGSCYFFYKALSIKKQLVKMDDETSI
ncbi:YrhC family protein [Bacillus spongiae]|uniref:YrhC family protein n=1 Tax=Bacillus spongiae TaxID=2683610 RepID=A0ABU8H926_9BACI